MGREDLVWPVGERSKGCRWLAHLQGREDAQEDPRSWVAGTGGPRGAGTQAAAGSLSVGSPGLGGGQGSAWGLLSHRHRHLLPGHHGWLASRPCWSETGRELGVPWQGEAGWGGAGKSGLGWLTTPHRFLRPQGPESTAQGATHLGSSGLVSSRGWWHLPELAPGICQPFPLSH